MKPSPSYVSAWLDFDVPEAAGARLWRAGPVTAVTAEEGGAVRLEFPWLGAVPGGAHLNGHPESRPGRLWVRAYGGAVVRLSTVPPDAAGDADSPMLAWDPSLASEALAVTEAPDGWKLLDGAGRTRLAIPRADLPAHPWSTLIRPPDPRFRAGVRPDGGEAAATFQDADTFTPVQVNSVPLGYVEQADGQRSFVVALTAAPDEAFVGTGERFARLNLAGTTQVLENADALGVNNRRAYKNIPFYLSSRGYGLFLHTSAHVRLSFADLSTRSVLLRADEPQLDLFVLGGGTPERILWNYRRLTGFPPEVPRWSYGVWMSRMTYFSAAECEAVADRLRAEDFPCDVLHLDTGWFRQDWKCEWEFSEERFPDPAGFMARLRAQGFRTTLWQTPWVAAGTKHHAEAERRRFIVPAKADARSGSDFSTAATPDNRAIDFSNPAAAEWYQGLLEGLLRLGAAAIKTDFGEFMDPQGDYHGLPYALLHNRYPLLYQGAAWVATARVHPQPLLWARAAWAGCQRYPVHWAGDCASTWESLAATLRGGLHFGLSGFAHWSHDVGGFHGLPEFMNHRPEEELYLRWTQAAVFGSHLRYHGTSAREPWEYPGVAAAVRGWLRLRYALIPYLEACARESARSGFPVLRALCLHDPADPACWAVDDQFLCGPDILVAPPLAPGGVRTVYLPAGRWVDWWTGAVAEGGRRLRVACPPERLPLWCRHGAAIPYYPERVAHTGEMEAGRVALLRFDDAYPGFARSALGPLTGLA